jgi:F420-dependent oxidoreductase-like protein
MKLSLTLTNTAGFSRDALVEFAQTADRLGYETLWVAEAYSWEAFSQLGWLAGVTQKIKLGTGVVNVFSRSPALLAQSAATVDRLSAGRFVLGLGTSGPQLVQGWHGVPFERAIQRLQETVEIVRTVLRRERLVHEGEVFKLRGGIKLVEEPVRSRVPVYLATLTPAGLRLTGEVADGWLGAFVSPAHYARSLGHDLQKGAQQRGVEAGPLETCAYQSVVVTSDRSAGRDAVRPQLALYIGAMGSRGHNFYNQLFRRYGFVEEAERIQRLYLDRQRDEAARAVTDAMVDEVTIIGSAPECRERLAELGRVGISEVALQLTAPGHGPDRMLAAVRDLAPR